MEPSQLSRGKLFQARVQKDWGGLIEGKTVRTEHTILTGLISADSKHMRKGRIDIFVDQMEDFVTVVEIKSTDWDKIKTKNIKKNLASHVRQLFRYIDKFLLVDKINVCAAIIYPSGPSTPGLKEKIEEYFNDHAFPVIWYNLP